MTPVLRPLHHVLVVDDDPAWVVLLTEAFREVDDTLALDAAHSVEDARGVLAAEAPVDLVIVDLNMPGTDGRSLLADLSGRAERRELAVVVLSASAAAEDRALAARLHAHGYLTKPTSFTELTDAVRALMTQLAGEQPLPSGVTPIGAPVGAAPEGAPALAQGGGATAPGQPDLQVVLVDDSPLDADLLRDRLHGEPLALTVMPDLTSLRQSDALERADCVLLDLGLPDAEGLEAVRAVRALAPTIPIVVLTGRRDDTFELAALGAGAQDYVRKDDASSDILMRSIRFAIERAGFGSSLAFQALHDPLTGLPNRTLLDERLTAAHAGAARTGGRVGLLFIDLDRFKPINDQFGHPTGDMVLVEVARRLRLAVRPLDLVARVGGDEFAVCLEQLSDVADAEMIAERIVELFEVPIELAAGHRERLGLSIGVATSDRAPGGPSVLLAAADLACYTAKRNGGGVALCQAPSEAAGGLAGRMAEALARGEIRPHFQGIADREGRLVALEALVRWEHPQHGTLGAPSVMRAAERAGLTLQVDLAILGAATQAVGEYRRSTSNSEVAVSVNVGASTLHECDFAAEVFDALERADLAPEACWVELHEAAATSDLIARKCCEELRAAGVTVVMDGFGAGYACLSHLDTLPLDVVKVDPDLVRRAAVTAGGRVILDAIVHLCSELGLRTVVEGIENADQLRTALDAGADLVQGFHVAAPGPLPPPRTWAGSGPAT